MLTEAEVAGRLNVSLSTLHRWRRDGEGPPWTKLGNNVRSPVRYDADALDAWLETRKMNGGEA